jgi:hypothetical protein
MVIDPGYENNSEAERECHYRWYDISECLPEIGITADGDRRGNFDVNNQQR